MQHFTHNQPNSNRPLIDNINLLENYFMQPNNIHINRIPINNFPLYNFQANNYYVNHQMN